MNCLRQYSNTWNRVLWYGPFGIFYYSSAFLIIVGESPIGQPLTPENVKENQYSGMDFGSA